MEWENQKYNMLSIEKLIPKFEGIDILPEETLHLIQVIYTLYKRDHVWNSILLIS